MLLVTCIIAWYSVSGNASSNDDDDDDDDDDDIIKMEIKIIKIKS